MLNWKEVQPNKTHSSKNINCSFNVIVLDPISLGLKNWDIENYTFIADIASCIAQ